jgi:hypothetical protein
MQGDTVAAAMQVGGQCRADAAAGTGNQDHGGIIRHHRISVQNRT